MGNAAFFDNSLYNKGKIMRDDYKKYGQYRIAALLLSVPYGLGFLWFYDVSSGTLANVFFASTPVALFLSSLTIDSFLKVTIFRRSMIVVKIVGGISCIFSMVEDLTLPHYPDFPAFILRVAVLFVLVKLLRRAWQYEPWLNASTNIPQQ